MVCSEPSDSVSAGSIKLTMPALAGWSVHFAAQLMLHASGSNHAEPLQCHGPRHVLDDAHCALDSRSNCQRESKRPLSRPPMCLRRLSSFLLCLRRSGSWSSFVMSHVCRGFWHMDRCWEGCASSWPRCWSMANLRRQMCCHLVSSGLHTRASARSTPLVYCTMTCAPRICWWRHRVMQHVV